jgi:tetratricopeptide (TPR) repeat protein
VTLRLVLPILLMLCGAVMAAEPAVDPASAKALLNSGNRQKALRAFDAIIAAKPLDPSEALYYSGLINLEDGNWQAAKPTLQRLVRLRPGSFPAWELMIQAYQAAGETENRDSAIEALYDAWHSALDPQTQALATFRRDRIPGPGYTLMALETLDPGGEDMVRFLFAPLGGQGQPRHLILVRTDNETNARWRDNGTVSSRTIVYHLDTVEQLANGKTSDRSYAFYLESPDYDDVRATVLKIMSGATKPLNGDADPYWTAGEGR